MSLASTSLTLVKSYNESISDTVKDTASKIGTGLSNTANAISNKFKTPKLSASHSPSTPYTTKEMTDSMKKRVDAPSPSSPDRPIAYGPGTNVKEIPMPKGPVHDTSSDLVSSHTNPSTASDLASKAKNIVNSASEYAHKVSNKASDYVHKVKDHFSTPEVNDKAIRGGETASFGNAARKAAASGDSKGALSATQYAANAGSHSGDSDWKTGISSLAGKVGQHFSDHAKEYAGGAALLGTGVLAGRLLSRKKRP